MNSRPPECPAAPMLPGSPARRLPATLCACLFFTTFFLSGCAVLLVGAYDPVTDQALQDLTKQTETAIVDVVEHQAAYKKYAAFYTEAQGEISAIELRSDLHPKNETEHALLEDLSQAYRNLEKIHREIGPFRMNETTGLRSLLRQLLHHQLSKKPGSGVSASDQTALPSAS